MKALDLRGLQQRLEKKTDNIYFLVGSEPFLIDEALLSIKNKVLSTGATDFNYDSFYSTDVDTAKVSDVIGTLPMMCPQRLVVFKQTHLLTEKQWEKLHAILESPVDTTVLVMVADKMDKRKKTYKTIIKNAVSVELKKPYDNKMGTWINYIAHKNQLSLSPDAVLFLQQLVGSNLNEIQNELIKLKQFVGEKNNVNSDDVAKVVSRSRVDSVFEFTEALGNNDKVKALTSLANLLDHGQNEVGILVLVNRHLKILSSVLEGRKQGLAPQKLSEKVGVPSFFMKQYLGQARNWNENKINQTITSLYETDKALKSSPVSSHIWLENFVLSVCT